MGPMKNILLLALTCSFFMSYAQEPNRDMGKKLVWHDEFNYNGPPDQKKWTYEEGFVRNEEPQYYTVANQNNCMVEGGYLVITARSKNLKNKKYDPNSQDNWRTKDSLARFTSASVITLGKQQWKYGRIEVLAKVPKGLGTWPAIWMLGKNREKIKWPHCGEIDIMEYLGKDSTRVYGTVHYSDSLMKYNLVGDTIVGATPYDGFHIYAIDWNKDRIEFYYDDVKYHVFDLKDANKKQGNPFRRPFYLLINLALGHEGGWPGPLDESILPVQFLIDYVRIYQ